MAARRKSSNLVSLQTLLLWLHFVMNVDGIPCGTRLTISKVKQTCFCIFMQLQRLVVVENTVIDQSKSVTFPLDSVLSKCVQTNPYSD